MTTSNELDTVSNSWDAHSAPHEHDGLPSHAAIQVAQAAQPAPAGDGQDLDEPSPLADQSGAHGLALPLRSRS